MPVAVHLSVTGPVRKRRERTSIIFTAILTVCVSALAAACATNPVTGHKQVSLLSEAEEEALGAQEDANVRREMGVYNDRQLENYISDVGMRLAAKSHRPNLRWSFTIVDSPAINAFALPGGYVYITRGILPYLDDESELAGVLGHEIGHVTARHTAQAYTRQQEAGIGLAILSIFVPGTQPFSDLSASGLGVLFLKNGRDAELEADRLGVEYASDAGWDPQGVPRFLETLHRVDALSERGVPNWLSTHPDPGNRVEKSTPVAAKFASADAHTVNRNEYLEHINGVVVGDNPKDGIVRGNVFVHPMIRMEVTFPEGWDVMNSAEQVMAREPGTNHYMVLQEVERPAGNSRATLGDTAIAAMRKAGYKSVEGHVERVNGLDAYVGTYHGQAKGVGDVTMKAAHIALGRQVFVIAGFAPDKEFTLVDRDLTPAINSFRELSTTEAARVRPNKLDFYTVKQGDSWQSIAARQGKGIVNAATLAIMNDHQVSAQPEVGMRVKIVTEG